MKNSVKIILYSSAILFIFSLSIQVLAQSADGSVPGTVTPDPKDPSASPDGTTTPPADPAGTNATTAPASTTSSTSLPRSSTGSVKPRPSNTLPVNSVDNPPMPDDTGHIADPIQETIPPSSTNKTLLITIISALGLGVVVSFISKAKKKSNPCKKIKKSRDKKGVELSMVSSQFLSAKSLLEKLEIELKEQAKEHFKELLKDKTLDAVGSAKLRKGVDLAEKSKKIYDSLVDKYGKAKEVFEALKYRKYILESELNSLDAACKKCAVVSSIKNDTETKAANFIAGRILKLLRNGKRVLWFVPGGSAIVVAAQVAKIIKKHRHGNLVVTLTDERYGPVGHPDSNWHQLLSKGFDLPKAELIPVLNGDDSPVTTKKFNTIIDAELEKADYKIGFFGVGKDGHTAGILPNSEAVKGEAWASLYQTPEFERITITPQTIEKLDEAIIWAQGKEKWEVLEDLEKDIDINIQPAQILKKVPKLTIFTDYKK